MLRSLVQALRLWSWGGIACDLVVVNAEPPSYLTSLQREIVTLRERHVAGSDAESSPGGAAAGGFYMLRADELSAEELSTLQALARVRLNADGRPLLHHVQEWTATHEQAFEERHETSTSVVARPPGITAGAPAASTGEFARASGEFSFEVSARSSPEQALDQRAGQPRLRRTAFRSRRRLHLGGEQPPEPAHRLVERPRGRPAGRMVPPAGSQDHGGVERGPVGLGR